MTTYTNDAAAAFIKQLKAPLDCIVVGSGVGGLTTASLLAQAGVSVMVLERAAQSGGATHGFKESGFEFEIGLQEVGAEVWRGLDSQEPFAHVLAQACNGTNSTTPPAVEWRRLEGDASYVVHYGTQEPFVVRNEWELVRADLVARFPDQAAVIDAFRALVMDTRACAVDWIRSRLQTPPAAAAATSPKSSSSWFFHKTTKQAPTAASSSSPPMAAFSPEQASKFKSLALRTVDQVFDSHLASASPELRYLLTFLWGKMGLPPKVASWGAFALLVGQFLFSGVAYPVGGAHQLELAMTKQIEQTGRGKCFVSCKVARLLCESDMCVGVVLEDGTELRSTRVVSAIGAVNTYERLVPVTMAEFVRVPLKAIKELKYSSYSVLQVFYGFEGSSQSLQLPTATSWFLPQDAPAAPLDHTDNAVRYFLDSTFTASFPYVHVSFPSAKSDPLADKSTCVVFAAAHYDWFEGMKQDHVERVAEEIVNRLSKQLFENFPQLRDKIRFAELATPLSQEFHLGANRGAMLGLGHTPSRFEQEWLRPLSPIKNLVLAGQDMLTASVVNASVGGYMAAASAFPQQIHGKFDKLF